MQLATATPSATPVPTPAPNRSAALLRLLVACQLTLTRWGRRLLDRLRDDRGQATTEYALVLLAAALVALLVVAWATAGGGGARISRLFNRVIDAVIDRV